MTHTVIMAHRGTEEHCRAHLPFWTQHGGPISLFSPDDLKVRMHNHTVWSHGHSGHHAPCANQRFLAMLRMCVETKADRFVIHEYDSVCFAPVSGIPDDHIAGIAYTDGAPNKPFVGGHFIHPPLFFSRPVLVRIVEILTNLRETERFMWDRWLGLCCERGGIPIYDLRTRGLGYSRNTIVAEDLPAAIQAIHGGAVCFHGIKSRQVFDALKQAGKW